MKVTKRAAVHLEVAAFALLAILPLIPYLVILTRGVPRYVVIADFASIEHDTRHVFAGETLLGLQSRFLWHHPGPLFFYFVAPFTALFGTASTGLFLGTWILMALAVGTVAAMTRISFTRATSIAVLVGLAAWFAAFGDVATNPWNRTVVAVPMLAYVAVAALFARGTKSAVYPLVFFGCVVAETHVSTVTTIGAIGAVSFASFLFHSRRRGTLKRDARHLAIAAALLVLFVAPMIVEELRAPAGSGNLTKLYTFLKHREEPFKTYANAFKNWGLATSWLPDRILDRSMATEGPLPMMMRWDPVQTGWSRTARTLTTIHILTAIAAFVVAVRRRDFESLALLVCGALGELVALSSLRAIAGEEHYSLLYWVAAPCIVTWMGVIAAFASWAAPHLARRTAKLRGAERLAILAGAACIVATTAIQRDWTTRNPRAPTTVPEFSSGIRAVMATVHERLTKAGGATPVIHMRGGWSLAAAVVLELEKDGVDVRFPKEDLWWFAGTRPADGVANPLHIWFQLPDLPIGITGCVEKAGQYGGFETYVSPVNVEVCPLPSE